MSVCEGKVREVIAEQLGYDLDEVPLDAELFVDLGADDLDRVELVMALEETFDTGNGIPDKEVEGWKTVRDVVASVEAATSEESRAARYRESVEAAGQLTLDAALAAREDSNA
jgi:acyl carrier protein